MIKTLICIMIFSSVYYSGFALQDNSRALYLRNLDVFFKFPFLFSGKPLSFCRIKSENKVSEFTLSYSKTGLLQTEGMSVLIGTRTLRITNFAEYIWDEKNRLKRAYINSDELLGIITPIDFIYSAHDDTMLESITEHQLRINIRHLFEYENGMIRTIRTFFINKNMIIKTENLPADIEILVSYQDGLISEIKEISIDHMNSLTSTLIRKYQYNNGPAGSFTGFTVIYYTNGSPEPLLIEQTSFSNEAPLTN